MILPEPEEFDDLELWREEPKPKTIDEKKRREELEQQGQMRFQWDS